MLVSPIAAEGGVLADAPACCVWSSNLSSCELSFAVLWRTRREEGEQHLKPFPSRTNSISSQGKAGWRSPPKPIRLLEPTCLDQWERRGFFIQTKCPRSNPEDSRFHIPNGTRRPPRGQTLTSRGLQPLRRAGHLVTAVLCHSAPSKGRTWLSSGRLHWTQCYK